MDDQYKDGWEDNEFWKEDNDTWEEDSIDNNPWVDDRYDISGNIMPVLGLVMLYAQDQKMIDEVLLCGKFTVTASTF